MVLQPEKPTLPHVNHIVDGVRSGEPPIKANPSWGQAVQPDAIRAIMRQARNNPAQEAAAKTRHLNVWVGADEALFSMRSWRETATATLSVHEFEGRECHLGLDLASRTDLAALALVFPFQDPTTG